MTKEQIIERLEKISVRLLGKEAGAEVELERAANEGETLYSSFLKGQKDALRAAGEMVDGLLDDIHRGD